MFEHELHCRYYFLIMPFLFQVFQVHPWPRLGVKCKGSTAATCLIIWLTEIPNTWKIMMLNIIRGIFPSCIIGLFIFMMIHQMETFSVLLALCLGNSSLPVNPPQRRQWRGALMFSLICPCIKGSVHNREAGDLRRHCAHCDVIIMLTKDPSSMGDGIAVNPRPLPYILRLWMLMS